jgi:hypothetical protein
VFYAFNYRERVFFKVFLFRTVNKSFFEKYVRMCNIRYGTCILLTRLASGEVIMLYNPCEV